MNKPRYDNSITLGHILQVIAILSAGIFFAVRLEGRIDQNSLKITHEREMRETIVGAMDDDITEIKKGVHEIKRYLIPQQRPMP